MLFPFALSSSLKNRAADVPVMPVPTITISALEGSSSVVRWPSKNLFGSLCQNEFDDVGVGRVARECFMTLIVECKWDAGRGALELECLNYIAIALGYEKG